jgi:hypothetical protein
MNDQKPPIIGSNHEEREEKPGIGWNLFAIPETDELILLLFIIASIVLLWAYLAARWIP